MNRVKYLGLFVLSTLDAEHVKIKVGAVRAALCCGGCRSKYLYYIISNDKTLSHSTFTINF